MILSNLKINIEVVKDMWSRSNTNFLYFLKLKDKTSLLVLGRDLSNVHYKKNLF